METKEFSASALLGTPKHNPSFPSRWILDLDNLMKVLAAFAVLLWGSGEVFAI
jgi:hypothetical protein